MHAQNPVKKNTPVHSRGTRSFPFWRFISLSLSLYCSIGFATGFYILDFQWKGLLAIALIHVLGLFVSMTLTERALRKKYDHYPAISETLHLHSNKTKPLSQRILEKDFLLEHRQTIPMTRAARTAILSFCFVGIPSAMTIWFVEFPNFLKALFALGLFALQSIFLYSSILVISRLAINQLFAILSTQNNWSSVFTREILRPFKPMYQDEGLGILSILSIPVLTQFYDFIYLIGLEPKPVMALQSIIVLVASGLGAAYIWIIYRLKHLQTIHRIMDLYTGPLIEPMIEVHRSAEKMRFWSLGEMTAMITHDLSAPIHGIQYSAQRLNELNRDENVKKYINQIHLNSDRTIELLNALRARMRNPDHQSPTHTASFGMAHDYVMKILSVTLPQSLISNVDLHICNKLRNLRLAIAQVDLIQILENLYRNSFKAMMKNERGSLEILTGAKKDGLVEIILKDSGPGLGPEVFENLTQFKFIEGKISGYKGLGLRLTNAMIKSYGGRLDCRVPDNNDQTGAQLHIWLPIYE